VTSDTARPRLGSLGWRLLAAFASVAVAAMGLVAVAALIGTGRGIDRVADAERTRVAIEVAASAAAAYRAAGGWDGADLREAEAIASAAGATLVIVGPDGATITAAPVAATNATPQSGDASPAAARRAPTRTRTGSIGLLRASHSPSTASSGAPAAGSAPARPSARPGSNTPSVSRPPVPEPSTSNRATPSPSRTVPPRSASPTPVPTSTIAPPGIDAPVVVDGIAVGFIGLVFEADQASTARDIAWRWIGVAALASLLLALLVGLTVTRRIARPLMTVAGTAQAFSAGDRGARTGVTGPGEIGVVARSVDGMADAVVRSESSQRRLAANVAHELRTPLAALQLGLEETRDGLVEPDVELLTGLHDQSLRLGRIVDDLAALSAADATTFSLHWAPLDLGALAVSEARAQEALLRAAGLTLTADGGDPVWVEGDPDRLRQVVDNLLSNTARYCRSGDAVTVAVTHHDGSARLVVRDTGPGIPVDESPHAFDRFWRGRASKGAAGLGLGLAVVRELVIAHHGSVRIDSDGSSGTSVIVEMPLLPGRV
jgi:two-component system, OmpR family, sensor histidine kinase BaeS